MQAESHVRGRGGIAFAERLIRGYATALLLTGAVWDVGNRVAGPLPWYPPVSYVCVAVGIAAACLAVLLHLLFTPRAAHHRRATLLELLALGVLLGAWTLRGHAEIPPDPPLLLAQAVGVLVQLTALTLRRRTATA